MPMTKDQILREVMSLEPPERERVAEAFWQILEGLTLPEIESAWAKEAADRARAVDRGEMGTIPGDQVFSDVRRRLRP